MKTTTTIFMKTKSPFFKKTAIIFTFFSILSAATVSAQTNIVTNPSFESNNSGLRNTSHAPAGFVPNVNFKVGTTYTGWTGGTANAFNNIIYTNAIDKAYDGFIFIEINGVTLSQTLTVIPNTTYYVTGRATNTGTANQETLGIYIDGELITSAGNSGTPAWQQAPITSFTPTSSTVTLELKPELGSPVIDLIYVGTHPLPVELLAFTAEPLGNKNALLQWTTASEINNSHFDVERSYDGRTFEAIGEAAGNGNSQHQIEYSYTDASVSKVQNTVYYRLKQVDFDGAFEYSDIRVVRFDALGNVQLVAYPNPLNDELNVMVGLSNGESYQLEVTNLQGKLVHQENHTYDNGIHKLNTSEWNSGMYIVRVATKHATKHMKVVKK